MKDDGRAPQRAIYSISKAAKHVGIRRETIRLAVKRGDLQMRHLSGRKRPFITHLDLMIWLSSLDVVRPPAPSLGPSKSP